MNEGRNYDTLNLSKNLQITARTFKRGVFNDAVITAQFMKFCMSSHRK